MTTHEPLSTRLTGTAPDIERAKDALLETAVAIGLDRVDWSTAKVEETSWRMSTGGRLYEVTVSALCHEPGGKADQ